MRWIALLPPPERQAGQTQQELVWHAMRFSPRVCLLDEAVLVEVSGSERLFGGLRPLLKQLLQFDPASDHACVVLRHAQGGSALTAVGRLRASLLEPAALRWPADQLPLRVLRAANTHLAVLERVGCRRWGDLRRLPRAGVARRFGQPLLDALDQAYGEQTESHCWLRLPEVFEARLELQALVENAAALLFAAQRLLHKLQAWLLARSSGVLALKLVWFLDPRRHGAASGELVIRMAEAAQTMSHVSRLLAEQLAHVCLPAPVHSLSLCSLEVVPLAPCNHSLLLQEQKHGDSLAQLTERLSARLGPAQVRRWQPSASHVPERMQHWVAAQGSHSFSCAGGPPVPADDLLPTWLLQTPLELALSQDRPLYGGRLTLLAGPQRLETSGWAISGLAQLQPQGEAAALRDYFVAINSQASLLWIYRERLVSSSAWYLHGVFA